MLVGQGGELPLPWLGTALSNALQSQRGHALLLQAAPGNGALSLAMLLAQAWLCEAGQGEAKPCGHCISCRLMAGQSHPDLRLLMPETLRREHAWPLPQERLDADEGKRKPSRQIKVDEVRDVIDWIWTTSGRGRGKVVVLHPAEAMRPIAASAWLKTLEEPPAGTRIVLTATDPAWLLPTVVSRCHRIVLAEPPPAVALGWLQQQGVQSPEVLLRACSGRPLDALALSRDGVDAAAWARLPAAVAAGKVAAFNGWSVPRIVDALQKVCHDSLALALSAPPRFFEADRLAATGSPEALAAWSRELERVSRHDEHAWNEALLVESLVKAGAAALGARPAARPPAERRARTET